MMPGGVDVEILTTYPEDESIGHAVQSVLSIWKHGVVEDSETSRLLRVDELTDLQSVFVFKDRFAWGAWTNHGLTKRYARSMIIVTLYNGGVVTCTVYDPEDTETKQILASVQDGLLRGPVTARPPSINPDLYLRESRPE